MDCAEIRAGNAESLSICVGWQTDRSFTVVGEDVYNLRKISIAEVPASVIDREKFREALTKWHHHAPIVTGIQTPIPIPTNPWRTTR